jgi:hypothetical protein
MSTYSQAREAASAIRVLSNLTVMYELATKSGKVASALALDDEYHARLVDIGQRWQSESSWMNRTTIAVDSNGVAVVL